MKVYTVTLEWLFDDNQGLEIEIFDTYEKAKNYFYNAIKNEQNPDNSWVGDMAFENGELQDGYELDCSPDYRDNDIHELWWYLTCKNDYTEWMYIDLKVMEVK